MRFLSADTIFDGQQFLPSGSILVLDGQSRLESVLNAGTIEDNRIERLVGSITPGFINAHCHLELSHLSGKIAKHTGIAGFAMELMSKRAGFHPEEVQEHMLHADLEMFQNGIVAVGDICNGQESIAIKTQSKLQYHSFVELIGLNPKNANIIFEKGMELYNSFYREGLSASIVPHAPYSVSPNLAQTISKFDREQNLPICIHNQESKAEDDFYHGLKGPINALYDFLKLDISYFEAPNTSSIKFLEKVLNVRPRIFVHNTFTTAEEVKLVADDATYWCFCPVANLYIENRLPTYTNFKGRAFCFGTDSLASNEVLDLMVEVNTMMQNDSTFSILEILRGLTSVAASAIGLQEHWGNLTMGKNVGLNHIALKQNQFTFIKKLS